MKRVSGSIFLIGLFITLLSSNPVWAQAGGHASVGLGHGEEGYLHLQEMVKHFEFSLKMDDASPDLKMHGAESLKHARQALRHYNEALIHASESLGRPAGNLMMGGGSGGEHSHEEGSGHNEGPQKAAVSTGQRNTIILNKKMECCKWPTEPELNTPFHRSKRYGIVGKKASL